MNSRSLIFLLLLQYTVTSNGADIEKKGKETSSSSKNTNDEDVLNHHTPSAVHNIDQSLSEQKVDDAKLRDEKRIKLARQRWKKTFEEIKSIVVDFSPETQKKNGKEKAKLLDQWKLLLDGENQVLRMENETVHSSMPSNSTVVTVSEVEGKPRRSRQRFEGFANWDRMLQDWADEISTKNPDEKKRKEIRLEIITNETSRVKFAPRPAMEGEAILPHTDIGDKSKNIWIVTTASFPWMTGTAVNPLLRASFLTEGRKEAGGKVTLMLPWLEREKDRDKIYGKERAFDTAEEQEEWIRTWLREKACLPEASEDLNIAWYIGRHETLENSIYSMGDITAMIPKEDADICVLEEPEHLNWYRAPGESWTSKFAHVVGIVHTNYFVYAQEQPAAYLRAPGMRLLSSWMCRAHCHRIIKLSGTLDKFAPEKELVENVHGVRNTFLDYGKELSQVLQTEEGKNHPVFGADADPKVYFIGKMLWSKGIGSLMELLKYAEESADLSITFDMYGGGPDLEEAKKRSSKLDLSMDFHGPIDHAALTSTHKIFVNPSLSEVLCTTVAEALAMGKFVIVPSHPSNDFFAQFQNCLTYANKEEFVGNLYYALTHSPEPLSNEYSYALSWEAANERFAAAGCITENEAEEYRRAMESDAAGIEIGLPPIIEDEKRRKSLSTTVKKTRDRYREFRSKLSQEIRQSYVLPKDLQSRMLSEIDKRLDLDVDSLLSSPKLKIQLSPAELDRQLLDLYNKVADNPGSDILRTVLGGANVGRQSYYLKQQTRKEKTRSRIEKDSKVSIPQFLDDEGVGGNKSVTTWVKKTLRRNMNSDVMKSSKDKTTMTTSPFGVSSGNRFRTHQPVAIKAGQFTHTRPSRVPSLLI